MANVEITSKNAVNGSVVIDGHDISACVRSATVHAKAGDLTTVTLDLVVLDGTTVDAEWADVIVPEKTQHALVLLGWTPPEPASDE